MGGASPPPPLLLGDADVEEYLTASQATAVMRAAIVAHARGQAACPPRQRIAAGARSIVLTAGTASDGAFGFRAYETTTDVDQLVAVWRPSGELQAVVTGTELGKARTGAIGAVAVGCLARPDAARLAVIGSGPQAWRQVWAISAIRALRQVTVFSPTPARRTALAGRVSAELKMSCAAAATARAAVQDADIVVLATSSGEPVIEAGWIRPGTHISTIGPKTTQAHELPAELARAAAVLVTDSREQALSYSPAYVLDPARLVGLGSVLTGQAAGRASDDDITLFGSVGLSGTEVALAGHLARVVASAQANKRSF